MLCFLCIFQDGEPVNTSDKKSHRVLFKDGALFFYRTVQSKKEHDSGLYWCVAKNHVGKVASRKASLQIARKCSQILCIYMQLLKCNNIAINETKNLTSGK